MPGRVAGGFGRVAVVRGAVALGILTLVGCQVGSLSGPGVVVLGANATYTMVYAAEFGAANATPVVYADVPAGWTVVSSSYSGTVNGSPASGAGTLVPTDPGVCTSLGGVAPGYQRLYFAAGPFPLVLATDSASLSITFQVAGQPGNYTLSFSGGATSAGPGFCQTTPATLPVTVTAEAIPAMNRWGMAAFAALLLVVAAVALRKALPA